MESTAPQDIAPERRRTQEERREQTRARLLQATVECLTERGYQGTTTLEVERRAGVSRGARIHHFPTKAVLLAAAVDHLYAEFGSHYDEAFADATGDVSEAQRFRRGFELLWSIYCQPGYLASLELLMAARTDEELREHIDAVGERHRQLAVEAAARHFPSLDTHTASVLIETLHASMMGLLLQRGGVGENPFEKDVLSLLEGAVTQHLPAEDA